MGLWYRSLDAHHFMNLELEKKVEEYRERLEDLVNHSPIPKGLVFQLVQSFLHSAGGLGSLHLLHEHHPFLEAHGLLRRHHGVEVVVHNTLLGRALPL